MSGVIRVLRWFEKDPGSRLVGEAIMARANLTQLQILFDVPAENPMYDCWLVGPDQANAVAVMAGITLELNRFDYFVEADAAT